MKVIAIVILICIGVYLLAGIVLRKKLLLPMPVLIGMVVCGGVIAFSNASGQNNQENTKYVKVSVAYKDAPYILQTPDRGYYVATFRDDGEFLTLTDYYFYDKDKWEYSDSPLPFDRGLPEFKNLEIIKRPRGG